MRSAIAVFVWKRVRTHPDRSPQSSSSIASTPCRSCVGVRHLGGPVDRGWTALRGSGRARRRSCPRRRRGAVTSWTKSLTGVSPSRTTGEGGSRRARPVVGSRPCARASRAPPDRFRSVVSQHLDVNTSSRRRCNERGPSGVAVNGTPSCCGSGTALGQDDRSTAGRRLARSGETPRRPAPPRLGCLVREVLEPAASGAGSARTERRPAAPASLRPRARGAAWLPSPGCARTTSPGSPRRTKTTKPFSRTTPFPPYASDSILRSSSSSGRTGAAMRPA
jgi:hypothetical protein